jgi:hypothetical protein
VRYQFSKKLGWFFISLWFEGCGRAISLRHEDFLPGANKPYSDSIRGLNLQETS